MTKEELEVLKRRLLSNTTLYTEYANDIRILFEYIEQLQEDCDDWRYEYNSRD